MLSGIKTRKTHQAEHVMHMRKLTKLDSTQVLCNDFSHDNSGILNGRMCYRYVCS